MLCNLLFRALLLQPVCATWGSRQTQVLREYKFRYRPLPLFCADPDLPGLLAYVGRRVVERDLQLCAQMDPIARDAQLGLSELRYFEINEQRAEDRRARRRARPPSVPKWFPL